MKIGLIGLGVMGWRIGANLAKDSKLDFVYDRTLSKAEDFSKKYGTKYFTSIKDLVKNSDYVLTMLSDDNAVSSVYGDIIPESSGKILVDMSTISPSLSIEISKKIKENGGIMCDSPVIGTSIFVEQKRITFLVGGPKDKFTDVKNILQSTASNIFYMGSNGMGLYAKLVNNLLLGAYASALAEAFNFGIKSGLDPNDVVKLLSELSSSKSPTSEIKSPKMLNGDYSTQFATKHMRKDLEIVQKESQNLKVITPLSSLALQLFRMAEAMGYSEADYISVVEVFKRFSPK
ncbi:NAD(P)-dependent oxidoreductase [Acidianus brierleyi]|uniref:3-hydroxyisobutyrate dehydrogenase n=1 Tax=Acidianus brierleyi TaxID=41673 RepID=A0A2U9IG58_9CREN|nr:NAD(P)-dependent oxidoreductase [Acidianus brierleyi]AWR95037.1 NAD-binding protein [Acidianus brierleyi]